MAESDRRRVLAMEKATATQPQPPESLPPETPTPPPQPDTGDDDDAALPPLAEDAAALDTAAAPGMSWSRGDTEREVRLIGGRPVTVTAEGDTVKTARHIVTCPDGHRYAIRLREDALGLAVEFAAGDGGPDSATP